MEKKDFCEAVKERRSMYSIGEESPVGDERLEEIVMGAVKFCPSAFNSQGSRAILLLGENHHRLWDIVLEALRKVVPAESFEATQKKISSFRNGHGSVMFFEDQGIVEWLQREYPTYKEQFPIWAQQSNGMLQFIVWTAFEAEGLGVSLQHYCPLIEEDVKKEWDIPANWQLVAEMPFGKPESSPGPKDFKPIEARVKVFE